MLMRCTTPAACALERSSHHISGMALCRMLSKFLQARKHLVQCYSLLWVRMQARSDCETQGVLQMPCCEASRLIRLVFFNCFVLCPASQSYLFQIVQYTAQVLAADFKILGKVVLLYPLPPCQSVQDHYCQIKVGLTLQDTSNIARKAGLLLSTEVSLTAS